MPKTMQPQHRLNNCLYHTPFRALHCKCCIANVRETDTPKATYMVQAICQAWNQSRVSVRVRSVGAASSNIAAILTKCTWEGNNWRIDAHIHDVFYLPIQAVLRIFDFIFCLSTKFHQQIKHYLIDNIRYTLS